ncbi:MAG: class I SAM-dependent methyltransferase [Acidimicrobiales bacterium]|jgi:ubiquinone/menaquinone biosynthesis C-methylase UbiE
MPESVAMSDGERSARQYDAMAVAYAVDNAEGSYNACYERPATVSLLGDVRGRRVLDVGCGAGPLTAWLVDHGAVVTAFDVSPEMVSLARKLVGDRAGFLVADLGRPLSFAEDGSFDLVVASLVLHYVRDWDAVLLEFRRVLAPGGSVVFSTHHPTMDWKLHCPDDYFVVKQVTETWAKGSGEFEVTFWRRPLTVMAESIASAGFVIERLVEPEPLSELEEWDPISYEKLRTTPSFLFFRLRVDD